MIYRYEPLRGPTAVRLLRLEPGVLGQRLEFSLEEHALEDCPTFEAISYVWGDATDRVPTSCSGYDFQVTKSLTAALGRFRYADCDRLLWADAICINQEDLIERGNQVRLMWQIYEQCQGVLVWLGSEDETTKSALALLERIVEEAYRNHGNSVPTLTSWLDYDSFVEFDASGQLPAADSPQWLPVKAIFSRAWFGRTWVVQEVNASKNVSVFCGGCTIPWQHLGIAALWIHRQVMKDDFKQWHIFEEGNLFEATMMFDKAWLEDSDFLASLNLFRALFATDPRDKVFALLNLASFADVSDRISPEYTRTPVDVYRSIVELSLSYHENLNILSYIHHDDPLPTDWPTWVPRWDVAPAAGSLIRHTESDRYFACGDDLKLSDFGYNFEAESLALSGQLLGNITQISETITAKHIQEIPDTNSQTRHPVRDFLNIQLTGLKNYHKEDRTVLLVIRLCHTMTIGENSNYEDITRDSDPDRKILHRHFADFAAYMTRFDPTSPSLQEIAEVFNNEDDYDGDASNFEVAASRVCDDRRLFLFGDEYIGIGPKSMRPGDQLHILFGGQMLYVLRPVGDYHHFVGECFVDGLMFGSGLQTNEQGEQIRQEIQLR